MDIHVPLMVPHVIWCCFQPYINCCQDYHSFDKRLAYRLVQSLLCFVMLQPTNWPLSFDVLNSRRVSLLIAKQFDHYLGACWSYTSSSNFMLIKLCLMHPNKQAANVIMLLADVYTCSTRIREKGAHPYIIRTFRNICT